MLRLFENQFIRRFLNPAPYQGGFPLQRLASSRLIPIRFTSRFCQLRGFASRACQGGFVLSRRPPGRTGAERFFRTAPAGRRRRRTGAERFFQKAPFYRRAGPAAAARQRGVAVFEMLFLLLFFVTLFSFTLGFWGAAHTATLQSIAARHYAHEVLNNRTHYEYHRDWLLDDPGNSDKMVGGNVEGEKEKYIEPMGARFFFISGEFNKKQQFMSKRGLNFFKVINDTDEQSPEAPKSPVIRIKTGYGILF